LPPRPVRPLVAARPAVAAAAEAVTRRAVGVAASAAARLLARRPAIRAAAGLVHEAAALVELLLAGREHELLAAVTAGQGAIAKGHRVISWWVIVGRVGSPGAR